MSCPSEEDALPHFVTEGLLSGTCLVTARGIREVTALRPGDLLLTGEAGFTEIRAVQRAFCDAGPAGWPGMHWPLEIPAGALGNPSVLRLLPEQPVLVLAGAEAVAVPAAALEGRGGICRTRPQAMEEVVILQLSEGALVCAEGDLQLYCPPDTLGLPPGFLPYDLPDVPLADLAGARALIGALDAAEEAPPEGDALMFTQAALRALSP
ncbi:Hint domain-containing protein [Falsigemmobacter faecalis]|uniref:Hedgehog/Intein (Hint) domain-containing protein n=1 Tax=Falsigemmobacter faecalis TaxID=2488730 RepID=A0A3P3DPM7_9RHOB|nr:Hint domain-containing protein [Falsigemmobacter faecalis]RRH75502.1 hypothetical protein EG244_08440 [Falsigemmobacter faecalis]